MRVAGRQNEASENDLKNNRLGLMSQAQIFALQQQIGFSQARAAQLARRSIALAVMVTAGVVMLSFVRVLLLPMTMMLEIAAVGAMIYLNASFSRFVQQLTLDCESETVRIVKGRTSRYAMRTHPLYHTLRVEVQNYKLLDAALLRQFVDGELYQLYVLPRSGVIIAAEKIGEKGSPYHG